MITNDEEFKKVASELTYRFAKTYAKKSPHEYCYCNSEVEEEKLTRIRELNKYIQEHGEKEKYYNTTFDVYYCSDGHKYWSMEYWGSTHILNRNWDRKNEDGTIDRSETNKRLDK